jgi:pyridoxal phosphate enzyme (YggS family)
MPDVTEDRPKAAAEQIAERLASVRLRLARAAERSGRDPASVRLIAVTKTVPPEQIAAAVALGVNEIGENRVQEARLKHASVPPGLRWHLIGHLQANKASLAARLFDTVHSLDSERVGAALSDHRDPELQQIAGLVEVDYTGISARSGVPPESVAGLLRALTAYPELDVRGLMTIAPAGDPGAARDCFRRLRELRDDLRERLGLELPDLSMGMSDDFEVAVEEGATMVRLGRVIFGERMPAGVRPPG